MFLQCKSQPTQAPPARSHTHPANTQPCMCEHKHAYTQRRRVWLTALSSRQRVKTRTARQRSSVTESNAGPASRSHRNHPTFSLSFSLPLSPISQLYLCVELEKKKYPLSHSLTLALSLSFSLSYGGINREKMSLWYSTRPEWPDSSNCKYASLLLPIPHTHAYVQRKYFCVNSYLNVYVYFQCNFDKTPNDGWISRREMDCSDSHRMICFVYVTRLVLRRIFLVRL